MVKDQSTGPEKLLLDLVLLVRPNSNSGVKESKPLGPGNISKQSIDHALMETRIRPDIHAYHDVVVEVTITTDIPDDVKPMRSAFSARIIHPPPATHTFTILFTFNFLEFFALKGQKASFPPTQTMTLAMCHRKGTRHVHEARDTST